MSGWLYPLARCLTFLSQLAVFGLLLSSVTPFFQKGHRPRETFLFAVAFFRLSGSVFRYFCFPLSVSGDEQRSCEVISYSIKRATLIGDTIDIGERNSRNRLTSIKSLIAGAHAPAHAHARSRARIQRRHAGSFMRVNICVGFTSTSANKTHDCAHKLI